MACNNATSFNYLITCIELFNCIAGWSIRQNQALVGFLWQNIMLFPFKKIKKHRILSITCGLLVSNFIALNHLLLQQHLLRVVQSCNEVTLKFKLASVIKIYTHELNENWKEEIRKQIVYERIQMYNCIIVYRKLLTSKEIKLAD